MPRPFPRVPCGAKQALVEEQGENAPAACKKSLPRRRYVAGNPYLCLVRIRSAPRIPDSKSHNI